MFDEPYDHLAKGKLLEAIEVLSRAWCNRPIPRLGDLIDAIAARLPQTPIEDKWISRARDHEPADLNGLLMTLRSGTLKDTTLRIRTLKAYGRDPRVASALFKIVAEVPFTSNGSRPTWLVIFDRLAELADPRVIERMDSVKQNWGIRENQRAWLAPRVDALVAGLREKIPENLYAIDAKTNEAISRLEETLTNTPLTNKHKTSPKESSEDLLAAILADPEDRNLRAVYADWLQEHGDPRGELIALQLQAQRTKPGIARERALLKQYEREWIGPIAPVVNKGGTVFERGFLTVCDVRFRNERDVRAYGSLAAWATVERMRHGIPGSPPIDQMKWLTWIDPAMKSLRDVDVFPEALPNLCEAKEPWLIEKIRWGDWHADNVSAESYRLFASTDKLPKLRSLTLQSIPPAGWLATTRFAHTLKEIEIVEGFGEEQTPAVFLADVGTLENISRIVLTIHWKQHVELTRDRTGKPTIARAQVDAGRLWDLTRALDALPVGSLTELEVTAHPEIKSKLDTTRLPPLQTAMKRHKLARLDFKLA